MPTEDRVERYELPDGQVVKQLAFVTRYEALELLGALKDRGVIRTDATL